MLALFPGHSHQQYNRLLAVCKYIVGEELGYWSRAMTSDRQMHGRHMGGSAQ